MSFYSKLDTLHANLRKNRWLQYFSIFCRFALAAGFIPSGLVKIFDERFTNLSVNHPMGHYLEALYYTEYYYTFIGILQVTAAILLLIPRTATLGALIYFPIIINITILSLAVRFVGSHISAPLMVLANLFLILWDYHKIKYILPFNEPPEHKILREKNERIKKFPLKFAIGSLATLIVLIFILKNMYNIEPYNTLMDCERQAKKSKNPKAVDDFCNCIHTEGKPLNKCLKIYEKTLENSTRKL
ncbi:DoxX family protein [Emticicia sp. BO119]|uniref:DoxX family protein n=1 Tax=Emticicia sp. BO119 TaxID=2757768 RepID=UPI0015F0BE80|nr:DoxX family protein [Emticicia sp. BO119]MBA4849419.1 DoxX family protein [Emticicia sp. BO119]